jgi:hypothetical protein
MSPPAPLLLALNADNRRYISFTKSKSIQSPLQLVIRHFSRAFVPDTATVFPFRVLGGLTSFSFLDALLRHRARLRFRASTFTISASCCSSASRSGNHRELFLHQFRRILVHHFSEVRRTTPFIVEIRVLRF